MRTTTTFCWFFSTYSFILFLIACTQLSSSYAISPKAWLILIEIVYWSLVVYLSYSLAVYIHEKDKVKPPISFNNYINNRNEIILLVTAFILLFVIGIQTYLLAQYTDKEIRNTFHTWRFDVSDTEENETPAIQMDAMLTQVIGVFIISLVFVIGRIYSMFVMVPNNDPETKPILQMNTSGKHKRKRSKHAYIAVQTYAYFFLFLHLKFTIYLFVYLFLFDIIDICSSQ
jgi:hypothetical protein